jgi:predicted enzyme related to lactoylglutathione lyase
MTTSAQAPARNASAVRGRFDWHELMTTDPEAAKRFYSAVIGWGIQDLPDMNHQYSMWTVDGAGLAGLMQLPGEAARQGAPPHWLTYIESEDIDATFNQATQLGARTYVPPKDIPGVGRFTVLADPQGAEFAVFTPAADSPAKSGEPRFGDFTWHELMTSNERDAFDFYAQLFGWQKTSAMDMGEMGTYQMFGLSEAPMGGIYTIPPGMGAPPMWLPYVQVESADAAAERVKQHGGSIKNGPMEVPGGDRIAICADPQGATFAVHSRQRK